MEIEVVGCYGGQAGPEITQTTYRIGSSILIDAGSAARLPLEEQYKIRYILVSHSHLDHVKDIGFLADNTLGRGAAPITVISIPEVISAIRRHYFNNIIWPDFSHIPSSEAPAVVFREIELGQPFELDGYMFNTFKAVHPVPAVGFVAGNAAGSVIFSNDTGPNNLLWQTAARTPDLKALVVECSFPDSMQRIADLSGHLTPATLAQGLKSLARDDLEIYICHLKPDAIEQLHKEIARINGYRLKVLSGREIIRF